MKTKNNKGFPYKRLRGKPFVNKRGTYAIVNEKGKVIETFRLRWSAHTRLQELNKESYMFEKFEVIKVLSLSN